MKKKKKSYSKLFNREIHLKEYEDAILPEKMYTSGRASYAERNQIMIDQSDFCVVYFDENYLPPRRKNSNLRDIRFHDLRHTYASLLLNKGKEEGVTLKDIQVWLGHSDFSATANIYSHLDANSKTASLKALSHAGLLDS